MTGLFAACLPEGEVDSLFDETAGKLNIYYRNKVARYSHKRAKLRAWTAARLLGCVVNEYCGRDFASVEIVENEYGKPAIAGQPDFHFNLSHSGEWVVCAIDNCPLGVDLQEICIRTDLDIADRFFSCVEATDLRKKLPVSQRDYFFTLWALKESFVKAEGKGLSIALNSFSFRVIDSIKFSATEKTCAWKFMLYNVCDGYKLALCLAHDRFPVLLDWSDKIMKY